MSRSALSFVTSRFSRAISSCSGFICPWPGKACCGSSASFFTQSRSCDVCTPRSADACAYDTPRSLIRRTASSLNSRVNCRLSMTHLLLHKTPNSVSSEPGAAQTRFESHAFEWEAAWLHRRGGLDIPGGGSLCDAVEARLDLPPLLSHGALFELSIDANLRDHRAPCCVRDCRHAFLRPLSALFATRLHFSVSFHRRPRSFADPHSGPSRHIARRD